MGFFTGKKDGRGQILSTKADLLRMAEKANAELKQKNEWLHNRLAYLLVAVNALGQYSKLEPAEAKKVIDDFIKEQEIKLSEQVKVAKEKFIEDMAAGKPPTFTVLENPEQPK